MGQLRLFLDGNLESLLILQELVLWLDECIQLFGDALNLLVDIELIWLELLQSDLLFFFVAFHSTFIQNGISLWLSRWHRSVLNHRRFVIRLVNKEVWEVLVGVRFTLELLPIHLVKHMLDYINVEVFVWVQLDEFLLFLVKNQQENV